MNQEDEMTDWHPSWWVDYMEGELQWPMKKGMEWMFRHNPTHREILKNFIKLRRMVRKSDPIGAMPENEAYFNKLHDKIMSAVDQAQNMEMEEGKEKSSTEVLGIRR
ncbi:MAG: hypothetical protein H6624_19885 [Bdellovibrionaceae bacterium]|nr:hypothetical protein [Bdellovibrionales bacterium]MCB9086612.1 hypothetical protein [Pseudobdellovibrionaceae bacterium]